MNCNEKMKTLLAGSTEMPTEKELLKIDSRLEKLFADIKSDNGCLYLATHNGAAAAPDSFTDKTEFEAWYNEIFINAEFPKSTKITPRFALMFFAQFNARLTALRAGKICAVMSADEGRFTYRFHLVRESEGLWISEDLEKFAQPIMYEIFGE